MSGEPAESDLDAEEASRVLGALPLGVAVLGPDGRLAFANDALARLLAWADASDLPGRPWRELFDPEEAGRLEREALAGARPWRGEAVAVRHDGIHVPVELAVAPIERGRLALSLRDLSAEREARERLSATACRDGLTGLPNRRLLGDRLRVALAQAHRSRHRVAVIVLDLDRFKEVDGALGRDGGDELLRAFATRLAESVREGDTVARTGGDEFALLLPGLHYTEDLAAVSRKLVDSVRRPFAVGGGEVRVTASGGISLYPEDGEDGEALLRRADTAMYRAKERGRDNPSSSRRRWRRRRSSAASSSRASAGPWTAGR